jgi:hypothetical protein
MANNYGIYDFYWIRGTTSPFIVLYMQNGVPLPFDDARLTVCDKLGNLIFRLSYADNPGTGPGTVSKDIVTGRLTFHPTEEQTRALIASKVGTAKEKGKNKYEVELRDGADTNIYFMGTICAIGGLNDDEEIPS